MVYITRELSSATSANAPPHRPIRADTLDLKQKLAVALGQNGARYWQTLVQFLKGAIDRSEFEALAHKALKAEHVHLHNALILGILYNASTDVPGPSSRTVRRITRILPDGSTITEEEEEEPSRKRLRNLVAGLPRKERLRLKKLEKVGKLGANAIGGAASLGWAGSAADMLEKKRKDEEKRKVAEDRRKVRHYKSAIGAKDWKGQAVQATQQIAAVRGKLSFSAQQAVARALQAPLCVESKHLPDLDSIKDRMTLLAVENGMPGGVQHQAAAMVLSALQSHLQNVASSIITKIRANRTDGIKTNEPLRPASEYSNISLDPASYMPDPMRGSPALDAMDLDDSSPNSVQGSPARLLRSIQSDMSSRTSTSGIGTSFADSSMLSLASTAATSLAGPSSPSIRDGDSSGQFQDTSFGNSSTAADGENSAVNGGNRLKRSRDTMQGTDRSGAASTRLTVSDVAFLLEVAPHTVVEPMGQGTQERMLAPEWSDDSVFGAEDKTGRLCPYSSPERQLARSARLAATTHLSETSGAGADVPVRNRFVIDQSAPLRLLDRRTLAENEGRARPTKGGLSVPEYKDPQAVLTDVNGRKKDGLLHGSGAAAVHQHRHKDDIWDVVDPVALFGQLCE
ncbi:hypothetical protein NDA11_006581 [Ustilago hordei]|uniref:Uncharacterized protein n=1 Tax=Ustilago hordei TaxID=120017 RepID=I2FUG3_USTHO|nr:uncharacterized protein UHO2_04991 [Ustilago hordei]KAJ1043279.1 hypothetical protein NDA10_007816 [Ustilago hordei]KAJ1573011.1 hypothetical protein NDA12_002810 [Ustilago hordei]KAJ1577624.1 hypothetical protein NDA11_006581 [Ustilago hordei]KAJ1582192.1 hypothetical protein NDA15_004912 [Ustilago hordei]UTT89283.1 hypothetical protein NDA17_005918 [Ustilago hordei]